ncbi:MAG: hypothetical protein P8X55_11095, partial [Desulfosarcinaceae bacterium]
PPKRTLAALDPYGRPCEPTSRDTGSNGMFLVLELYREPRFEIVVDTSCLQKQTLAAVKCHVAFQMENALGPFRFSRYNAGLPRNPSQYMILRLNRQ